MKTVIQVCMAVILATIATTFASAEEDGNLGTNVAERVSKTYVRTGGHVLKPGTRLGSIVIANAQSRVSTPEVATVAERLRDKMRLNVNAIDGSPVDVSTASNEKEKIGAEVVVFVVEDDRLPLSLIALEERWGIVNIAKLNAPNLNKTRLFGRASAEVMRVVAYVCGAGESQFPGSILSVGDEPRALDGVPRELPIDAMNKMTVSLARVGVTPGIFSTYRTACKEGWAPAPTNQVQQAIWDKVHAPPKNPMKIEFDPKKGR